MLIMFNQSYHLNISISNLLLTNQQKQMKKVIFILALTTTSISLSAQLSGSKWKGSLQGDNPQEVIFDFRKDTAVVYTTQDNSHVETMTYTLKDKVLTFIKVHGISDCDNTPGKYNVTLEKDALTLKRLDDPCGDRADAVDTVKWVRVKPTGATK